MSVIEWKKEWLSKGKILIEARGYVGGEIVARYQNSTGTLFFLGRTITDQMTYDQAKAYLETLFTEWADKANMTVKPEPCEKCGNRGSVRTKHMDKCRYMRNINNKCSCGANDKCPCTKNPHSVYTYIKSLKEG